MPEPIGPAARRLLHQLAFRAPDPCYLVQAMRGREALVVTTGMGWLERHSAFNVKTIQQLGWARLVEFGDDQEIPKFAGRVRGDSTFGYPIAITEAGRAALNLEITGGGEPS